MAHPMGIDGADQRITRLENQVALWQAELDRAEASQVGLRQRLQELQEENRRLGEREAAAQQRLGQLAQLAAAISELHTAALPADVLRVIKEIVANLVGSEEMGIFARRPDGSFALLDGIGADARSEAAGRALDIDAALRTGEPPVSAGAPAACIPLRLAGSTIGLIAIFRLLPQKPALEASDLELLDLLGTHAALALHHAELRASV